jgi:hypothetical protein
MESTAKLSNILQDIKEEVQIGSGPKYLNFTGDII